MPNIISTDGSVDGNWSAWVNGTCSATCGDGTLVQTRACDSPVPQNGGAPCAGSSTQTVACTTDPCPGMQRQAILWLLFYLTPDRYQLSIMVQSTATGPRGSMAHARRHAVTARSPRPAHATAPCLRTVAPHALAHPRRQWRAPRTRVVCGNVVQPLYCLMALEG
jgi:hypothetical protein